MRRRSGRSASARAGLFMLPGGPTARPQRVGTTAQSPCRFGRIAICRPMTAAAATITPTATKSGGHWTRSAICATQGASGAGNRARLNGGTGGRHCGRGWGSGHGAHRGVAVLGCRRPFRGPTMGRIMPSVTTSPRRSRISPSPLKMNHRVRSHRRFGYQSIQDATASTMASMAETLGMTLPGNAAIPAADSRRMALAEMSGRRIMEMVREDLKPSKVLTREACTAILPGNLCQGGAVLKQSAASPHLLPHRGRAVVFEDHADLHARIDDPALDVDETCVLVLKRVGPKGAPGMPEWGAAPIPKKLLQKGVKDMVRISDARMSGTSYGTVVLHVSPEAEAGGPLPLGQNGDPVELDIPNRRLTLRVPDDELANRRARWKPRPPHFPRGHGRLFLDHVLPAHEGCDFHFLRGKTPVRAEDTAGPSHSSEAPWMRSLKY